MKIDLRVDDYINAAPEFARPILEKIRKAIHKGCPDVEESIKWGCPHFVHHGILGGMAAFKGHVSFGFWKSKDMDDPAGLFDSGTGKKMSMCNAHFKTVKDLPNQSVLVDYVRRAARLNEIDATKLPGSRQPKKKIAVRLPADLKNRLAANASANTVFAALAPSHRRDYIQWIEEAKRPATREKRLADTIQLLTENKTLHWKYNDRKK